uniref:GDPGP1-like N-terminal domain-containing protein n=1 Tax=Anguilla anguilla TaxID=7936 RepID=A0A0E9TKA2_ANGAN
MPQILTASAIQTGIESVFLSADSGFRVGFNSLGAFASVNHFTPPWILLRLGDCG